MFSGFLAHLMPLVSFNTPWNTHQRFSDVFRVYWKRPKAWNGLMNLLLPNSPPLSKTVMEYFYRLHLSQSLHYDCQWLQIFFCWINGFDLFVIFKASGIHAFVRALVSLRNWAPSFRYQMFLLLLAVVPLM